MYLVRRYLYFSWEEWERLPGYQQKAYTDMLQKAKPWTTDGGDADDKGRGSGGGGRSVDIEGTMSGIGRSTG